MKMFCAMLFVVLSATMLAGCADASLLTARSSLLSIAGQMSTGPGTAMPPLVFDLSQLHCDDLNFPTMPPAVPTPSPNSNQQTTGPVSSAPTGVVDTPNPTTHHHHRSTEPYTTNHATHHEHTTKHHSYTKTHTHNTEAPYTQGPKGHKTHKPTTKAASATPSTTAAQRTSGPSVTQTPGQVVPTTAVPSTMPPLPSPCQVKCVLSMTPEVFVKVSADFVLHVANCLNAEFHVTVGLTAYAAGSTVVYMTIDGFASSNTAILDLLTQQIDSTSTLASVYGLQSVALVSASNGDANSAPNVAAVNSGAAATNAPQGGNSKKSGSSTLAVAVGAGVGGGIFLLLVILAAVKRQPIIDAVSNSPASQLRRLRRQCSNKKTNGNLDKLTKLGDRAEVLFKKGCTCSFTGACDVCIAYKVFLHDCCWCRTESVMAQLTEIIGKARGPDVLQIQVQLEREVEHLSSQCGCNFGREWSEPAGETCRHEALAHEFFEVVRIQNIQHNRHTMQQSHVVNIAQENMAC